MKSRFLIHVIEVIYINESLNLEWYRIFLYTARFGSLTKAAQALHITQPTVSYAIKQLEEGLGAKLFDRLSKGVALTAEGQSLYLYVEKSLALLDTGESHVASLKNYAAGELRIGASGPMIKHLLLSPLDALRERHPDVRIRLSQGNTAAIQTRLKERQIDLGIVHMPLVDPELDVAQLATIEDCFVAGPAYAGLAERPLQTSELAALPLLLLSRGSSTRTFIQRWFADQGLRAEAEIELNSYEMLVELAWRGYGAAFVTRSLVSRELAEGKLFELRTAEPIPARSVGIATRRHASLPLIAERFRELLLSP